MRRGCEKLIVPVGSGQCLSLWTIPQRASIQGAMVCTNASARSSNFWRFGNFPLVSQRQGVLLQLLMVSTMILVWSDTRGAWSADDPDVSVALRDRSRAGSSPG